MCKAERYRYVKLEVASHSQQKQAKDHNKWRSQEDFPDRM
jgi:hypothetical protein